MMEDPEAEPARTLVPTKLVVRVSSGAHGASRATTLTSKEVR
jgi:hypothetical protein